MTSMPSPSETAVVLSIAIASLSLGYYLGAKSTGIAGASVPALKGNDDAKPEVKEASKALRADPEDDLDEEEADGDLSAVKPSGVSEPCKLVLVVRTDLNMTAGKIAAQCGHATLACYKVLAEKNPRLIRQWERIGQAKVALRASSEDELLELEAIAKSLNLCARSIQDAGRTQVEPGSRTVLGIGPGPVPLVNQVTGHLKLL
ncbi:peptidyl-tRNA hydrolase II [Heliocybe sulcata]|uniref:peptidyl-tRNA hydrolase n=1 Tax=Heliocybe sulcata TaxID=5364 RepID=A0A5C3NKN8_9AGAM|nr:peptidyl-tRNA hydrolase II [Heliocybe sulcata]